MPNATATLTIAGSVVDRAASRITLQRMTTGVDVDWSLDFTAEVVGSLSGPFSEGQSVAVSLTESSTTVRAFAGVISSAVVAGIGTGVISVGYHCVGLRFLANQVITTNTDGTGRVVYNLPTTDDNFILALSGLTVGTMLLDYLTLHSAQLSALGISLPPSGDLSPLVIVPLDPVILTGRILDAVDGLLAQWSQKYQLYLDPAALQLRVVDMTNPPASDTYTLDVDPVTVGSLSSDVSNCYTRCVLRGGANIDAAILDQVAGTLGQGWTSGQQSAWTWADYATPKNSCQGPISSMTSNTVTLTPTSGVLTWPLGQWGRGTISCAFGVIGTLGSIQMFETREVVNCPAFSSGACTVTVDSPFSSNSYTSFEIRGPLQGQSLVWRKYTIPSTIQRPSDGSPINLHLQKQLMHSVAWSPSGDSSVTQTTSPQLEIYRHLPGGDAGFGTLQIYPSTDGVTPGYIITDQPTVQAFSSLASLVAGTPDGIPGDIKMLVPYSEGALSAAAPATGHQGTAYSLYGWQQTFYKDISNWVYAGQSSNAALLAQMTLDTMKDAVIEGDLAYFGCPIAAMTPGRGINITGGMAAGAPYASMNCMVRRIDISWPDGTGAWQVCGFGFSNRRKAYQGDSLFIHPLMARNTTGTGAAIASGSPFEAAGANGYRSPETSTDFSGSRGAASDSSSMVDKAPGVDQSAAAAKGPAAERGPSYASRAVVNEAAGRRRAKAREDRKARKAARQRANHPDLEGSGGGGMGSDDRESTGGGGMASDRPFEASGGGGVAPALEGPGSGGSEEPFT